MTTIGFSGLLPTTGQEPDGICKTSLPKNRTGKEGYLGARNPLISLIDRPGRPVHDTHTDGQTFLALLALLLISILYPLLFDSRSSGLPAAGEKEIWTVKPWRSQKKTNDMQWLPGPARSSKTTNIHHFGASRNRVRTVSVLLTVYSFRRSDRV